MKKMQWTAIKDQDIQGIILFPKVLKGTAFVSSPSIKT